MGVEDFVLKMPCLFNEHMLKIILSLNYAGFYHFETYEHKSMYFL